MNCFDDDNDDNDDAFGGRGLNYLKPLDQAAYVQRFPLSANIDNCSHLFLHV
jgi:hypothetical protein